MLAKNLQFLSIVLTALALIPAGAHLLELRGKINLARDDYLTVQQVYSGWALAGIAIVAAIVCAGALAFTTREQTLPMLLAVAAAVLLILTLVTFFLFIFPVNQATENWTVLSADWEELRRRWEYTHAANAVLTIAALVCLVIGTLAWSD